MRLALTMLVNCVAQKYSPILAPKQSPAGAVCNNMLNEKRLLNRAKTPRDTNPIHDLQKAIASHCTSDDATMIGAIATNAYPN